MALNSKFRSVFRRQATDDAQDSAAVDTLDEKTTRIREDPAIEGNEKNKEDPAIGTTGTDGSGDLQDELPTENAQRGVHDVEAVTLTWTKTTLVAVFLKYVTVILAVTLFKIHLTVRPNSIWLLYFVNAFQSSILSNLLPYVTSEFESHSLLNVIYIVASAMSAAVYIPLSKVMDVWGRAQGFLIMTTFATLGLILMATCHNLPTFCAAYVRLSARWWQTRHYVDANR